jgi:hypothetical protein
MHKLLFSHHCLNLRAIIKFVAVDLLKSIETGIPKPGFVCLRIFY